MGDFACRDGIVLLFIVHVALALLVLALPVDDHPETSPRQAGMPPSKAGSSTMRSITHNGFGRRADRADDQGEPQWSRASSGCALRGTLSLGAITHATG